MDFPHQTSRNAQVVERLKEKPKARPGNVVEDKLEDWSLGKGVGRYMVPPRDNWK